MEERICSVPQCGKPLCSRGLCVAHYRSKRKNGELPLLERKPPKRCKAAGCDQPHLARGWCSSHYARWRNHGDAREAEPLQVVDGFKKCTRCQRVKAESEFGETRKAWCKRCVTIHHSNRRLGRTCAECSAPITNGSKSGLCVTCNGMSRRSWVVRRSLNAAGYVVLTGHWDHPNASARGRILEHVKVMSDALGRPLVRGENVHHINGDKTDNRPENLELWSTSQPSGQRVADKVEWAKELLSLYDPDALTEPMMLRVVS